MNFKKYFQILGLVYCLFVLGCGGGGSDGDSSGDSADACGVINLPTKIINGETCGGLEQASVVRVVAVIQDGDQLFASGLCTGTMVSSTDVLTAAHCFLETSIGDFPIIDYGILIGPLDNHRFIRSAGISIAPGVSFDDPSGRAFNDVAVMRLREDPGLPTLPILGSGNPSIGEIGYVYGYGNRSTDADDASSSDFSTLEAGAMTIQNVTPNHLFVSFNGDGSNVCNGDSGGPLVVTAPGGGAAISGVVSQGSIVGCGSGDISTFINLQSGSIFGWLTDLVPGIGIR